VRSIRFLTPSDRASRYRLANDWSEKRPDGADRPDRVKVCSTGLMTKQNGEWIDHCLPRVAIYRLQRSNFPGCELYFFAERPGPDRGVEPPRLLPNVLHPLFPDNFRPVNVANWHLRNTFGRNQSPYGRVWFPGQE